MLNFKSLGKVSNGLFGVWQYFESALAIFNTIGKSSLLLKAKNWTYNLGVWSHCKTCKNWPTTSSYRYKKYHKTIADILTLFKIELFLAFSFFRLFNTVGSILNFKWLDLNHQPLVSEATAPPTQPQPLHRHRIQNILTAEQLPPDFGIHLSTNFWFLAWSLGTANLLPRLGRLKVIIKFWSHTFQSF